MINVSNIEIHGNWILYKGFAFVEFEDVFRMYKGYYFEDGAIYGEDEVFANIWTYEGAINYVDGLSNDRE